MLNLHHGPAAALSCKPPNFALGFNVAADAEELYSLVFGVLSPLGSEALLANATTARFHLNGRRLGRNAFRPEETLIVEIQRHCVNRTCAPFPKTGSPHLLLVEHRGNDLAMDLRPCGQNLHLNPSLGRVSAIRACMRKGHCGAAEIEAFDLTQ